MKKNSKLTLLSCLVLVSILLTPAAIFAQESTLSMGVGQENPVPPRNFR